jgi:phospholipid/cholesterol/gamma-HCH transport system permease protein
MTSEAAIPERGPSERSLTVRVGRLTLDTVTAVGDLGLFAAGMLKWMVIRLPRAGVLLPNMYDIGFRSIAVVLVTGLFIGMVLSVQTYTQFKSLGMENRLGSIITMTLVNELGPVLAATMLAGRVGSSMAAELGTMRVTEQIDALRALGANPVQYLVVPRFLACFLLIPMLTALADVVGIFGGWFYSVKVLGISNFHYWYHATRYVAPFDIMSGLFKSIFFGAAIAVVGCHRGFHCGAGAEGVGRAATEAFVLSFVLILILDFLLNVLINTFYLIVWSNAPTLA